MWTLVSYSCVAALLYAAGVEGVARGPVARGPDGASCSAKFLNYNVRHTACLEAQVGSLKPVREGVSKRHQIYIVNLHNHYRGRVERYSHQPAATNMQKMYWDKELAMVAQKWASHCIWNHDDSSNRAIPGQYPVGQNLARGHRSWSGVIRHWQSEVKYLKFGSGRTLKKAIGHYTQMVWANTARVGCGYARCNRTSSYYVCNYATAGNMRNVRYKPYTPGKKTAECPNKAASGVCDCQGKVCLNGGTLDLNTCTCKCTQNKPWIRQSGDCSLDCSKAEDSFFCKSKWSFSDCDRYVNIPFEYCPVMCNLCPPARPATPIPLLGMTSYPLDITTGSNLGDTAAMWPQSTQVDPGLLRNTLWKSHKWGTTPPVINTTPATTKAATTKAASPKAASTKAASPTLGLSVCSKPVEMAKCGQPNPRGYYNARYCDYGLDHYCPAMCGKCLVTGCMDYESTHFKVGSKWRNEFGEISCTNHGVEVRRGCYVEKTDIVISRNEKYSFREGNINWQCLCNTGYSLSCKGVWTPTVK